MGILGKLSTLIKSNVNDVIDGMQDPAKEIDQMVRDMEDSARQARTEVAQCMGEEKRLQKRIEALDAEIKSWEDRAATAVRAGDDALAKEALLRKGEKEAERAETQKALQEQQVYVDQLAVGLKALDARVKDVKLRQGSLREKARASKRGGSPLVGRRPPSTTSSACRARSTRSRRRRASPTSSTDARRHRSRPNESSTSCRRKAPSTTRWPN